jgi:hypothetical protein
MDSLSPMLATRLNKLSVDRACLECDEVYRGPIRCPGCDKPSGEPLDPDTPLTAKSI